MSLALLYKTLELTYLLICFSLLPAAISALTLLVGCLSRARCRLAYGPADATATPYVFSKIQIGSTFLVPAHPGSPGKRAVKCVCVCVCVCYYLLHACVEWILNTVDWLLLVSCVVFLGSAAQHMRVFQRLVCGVWQPSSVELLKPNPYVFKTDVTPAVLSLEYTTLSRDKVTDAAWLSSCTLRLCGGINKHGCCAIFPVYDPPVFQSDEIVPYVISFRILRLVVRFRFTRQPAKTRLLSRISWSFMLVWFFYATKSQRATAQSHAATFLRDEVVQWNSRHRSNVSHHDYTTGALLINKPEATGVVILARWPLENNLKVRWAQVLHVKINRYSTIKQTTHHWWVLTTCFGVTDHSEAALLWLVRQE